MDVSAVSGVMAFKQMALQQAVGTSVAKISMDNAKQSGEMMVDLLKSAAPAGNAVSPPHLGNFVDISV